MHRFYISRRWLVLPIIVWAVAIVIFSCFYLLEDHAALLKWYYQLNDCFYRRDDFNLHFFNEATKAKGNKWCVAAMAFGLTTLIYIAVQWRNYGYKVKISIGCSARVACVYMALWAAGIALWLYGNANLFPATDELFSAVHCASVHPFQAMSYYMLPNNHMLFNLVNNVLSTKSMDSVLTGRLISLAAYLMLISAVFYFLKQQLKHSVPAFVTALIIAMQLPVWGFAVQARGYEMYLLASWVSFIAVFNYHLIDRTGRWLALFLLSCVVGFCTIPSFLYWGLAMVLFALAVQFSRRKIDLRFWKYALMGMLLVFFFYLPAIGFSGVAAFAENKYVKASDISQSIFIQDFSTTILYYVKSHFLGEWKWAYWQCYLLFLTPLLLLLTRRKGWVYTGVFFCVVWIVFIGLAMVMKRYPFPRNLIAHLSISLAFTCCACYLLINAICNHLKKPLFAPFIYSFIGLTSISYLFLSFKETAATALYGNNVNSTYMQEANSLKSIPVGSSIGCSDANFMFYYILQKKGCRVNKCDPGQEDFLIRHQEETFPVDVMSHYTLYEHIGEFELYKYHDADRHQFYQKAASIFPFILK